ncbi:MAG TPA: alpha/beta hydrolase-fold protein [Candidatus Limnocylindria bacterium]|jgi:enterochelin esterase-like enzyme|nr:alpha/beta hydrolase-fold protein [Candidatus Limnocylindria bacterium]
MFRTFEISDGRFESDGLRQVTVKSPALGHRADLTLFVPPQIQGWHDVPIVILLHGIYGSHWGWALQGGAHRTATRMIAAGELPPIVLAMPSDGLWGDGSGYVPHMPEGEAMRLSLAVLNDEMNPASVPKISSGDRQAPDFERWIVEEVPAAVNRAVPSTSPDSPLFIAGLSMGGFGALRLGAKYPRRFRAASGHSSATRAEQLQDAVEEGVGSYSPAEEDRSVLAAMIQHRAELPPFRFDCGTEDFLIEANRELHAGLEAAGIAHIYQEFPGGHTWPYWETHVADTLSFFGSVLKG